MASLPGFLLICLTLGRLLVPGSCELKEVKCVFPVVEPDFGHTKLRFAREGLDVIRRIKYPIAAVFISFWGFMLFFIVLVIAIKALLFLLTPKSAILSNVPIVSGFLLQVPFRKEQAIPDVHQVRARRTAGSKIAQGWMLRQPPARGGLRWPLWAARQGRPPMPGRTPPSPPRPPARGRPPRAGRIPPGIRPGRPLGGGLAGPGGFPLESAQAAR
ncbi:hypothetical protein KSP39_PZI016445 [Platanthera zijinensis]|uniref:Uncharacterized protein n=1 Tax=Platanthera zijinensis TaxID=2320716 RepID=A0AAP0B705_9ASPA